MKKFYELTYQQLLVFGVHVGHSFANSILYAAWLVYTYKQNILIMNIFKSLYVLKAGLRCFSICVLHRGPIWFINLDKAAFLYSKTSALYCGETSWTIDWIHGMIANFRQMVITFKRLKRDSSIWAYKGKNRWMAIKAKEWFYTRNTWPRSILVSSVHNSKPPVREALFLGIPCIGIVDTNTNSNLVSLAVPGNDESLDCLAFYSDLVANYVLIKKFNLLVTWYMSRKPDRILTFKDWLHLKIYRSRKKFKHSIRFNFVQNQILLPELSLKKNILFNTFFFFGRNSRLDTKSNSQLNVKKLLFNNKYAKIIDPRKLVYDFRIQRLWFYILAVIKNLVYEWRYNPPTIKRQRRYGRIGKRWGKRIWNCEKYFKFKNLRFKYYSKNFCSDRFYNTLNRFRKIAKGSIQKDF